MEHKTNVMRMLDSLGVSYRAHAYPVNGAPSGAEVAEMLGKDPACVFKTLVTVGGSGGHYVFVIPVSKELSLKKAAATVGEKSLAMLKSKELPPLTGYINSVTGYVRGGCSPIGMKRAFPTVADVSVTRCETMLVSAGKVGYQVEMRPEDAKRLVNYTVADVAE